MILTTFTLLFGFSVCHVCSLYTSSSVIMSMGLTSAVTVGLTMYAFWTKTDFTSFKGLFVAVGIIATIIFVSQFFLSFISWWQPLFAGVLTAFYSVFLVWDTQLIVGHGKHEISMDDYIFAALIIYVDILFIFLEVLKVFGTNR